MSDPHSPWFNPALIGLYGILLTGSGALIGYAVRYQLDKRKELVSEVNRERRAVYQQIVEFLFGMLKDTKQGKTTDTNKMVAELYRMSELIAVMRTDLGLSNKGMGKSNRRLLRVLITDIDKQP